MNKHRFSGFTLVELLVVIGIIALLISILLPSLARAREQSRMTKCVSNQREIGKGAAVFQNDHKDRLQLVASHQVVGEQSAIDRVDPTRTTFEYYDYPVNPYTGSMDSLRNKELVIWPVAYGEAAGFTFGKKNWKWGARADNYDDAVNLRASIEENSYNLGVCPSDKIKLGTPGWPDSKQVGEGGFAPDLQANGDLEPDDAANAVADHYYGALSYAMNEDIVGAEVPDTEGKIIPACFRGRGLDDTGAGVGDCLGGVDNPNCKGGPRLAGDISRVFQPSKTLLTVDAGTDRGPMVSSVQRVMLVNSDDFLLNPNGVDGLTSSPEQIRANLGWFTLQHQDGVVPGSPMTYTQVLPTRRHSDGRLNVIWADSHGTSITPVLFREDDSGGGPIRKIPALWADGISSVIWVSPYDVGRYYDPKLADPEWPN